MQEEGVSELLMKPGSSGVPGVVGTRCLNENLSDLKAQVAANAKGIALVKGLIAEYSLPVVQSYMHHIQSNAEAAVRSMLVQFSHSQVHCAPFCTCCMHLLWIPLVHAGCCGYAQAEIRTGNAFMSMW
jgi:hypothetical protein